MFDRIVVRSQKDGDADLLDLGALVEAMLFYGNVSLIVGMGTVAQLFRAWGPAGVLELATRGFLDLVATEKMTGVRTEHAGTARERYAPVTFVVSEKSGRRISVPERVMSTDAVKPYLRSTNEARKIAVRLRKMTQTLPAVPELVRRVELQLSNPSYTRKLATAVLSQVTPAYIPPAEVVFDLDKMPDGTFRLRTSIDFAKANELYANRFRPEHSILTPSMVLAHAVGCHELLELAASLGTDIACSPLQAQLMRSAIEGALLRADSNRAAIERFVDFTLDDARAIREAVNNGEKGIDDILSLLESARRFKEWLQGRPNDPDLVKEYFRAVRKSSWIDKLPGKSLRWAFFGALASFVPGGPAIGVGLSAADTFLLDRLIEGWKPNQFVEGPLRRFVE